MNVAHRVEGVLGTARLVVELSQSKTPNPYLLCSCPYHTTPTVGDGLQI